MKYKLALIFIVFYLGCITYKRGLPKKTFLYNNSCAILFSGTENCIDFTSKKVFIDLFNVPLHHNAIATKDGSDFDQLDDRDVISKFRALAGDSLSAEILYLIKEAKLNIVDNKSEADMIISSTGKVRIGNYEYSVFQFQEHTSFWSIKVKWDDDNIIATDLSSVRN